MASNYRDDPGYQATTATLPRVDWYHAKFMFRIFAAEALGVGIIIFILAVHSAGDELKSDLNGPIVTGAAFAVAVWTVGPVSGPQITPIISVARLLTRRINFVYFILGIMGQTFGAFMALLLGSRLVPGLSEKNNLVLQTPGPNVTDLQAFGIECVCSFILIVIFLSTLDEFRKPYCSQGQVSSFSIIVFFMLLVLSAVMIKTTGTGLHPSKSLAAALYNRSFEKLWVSSLI
ncbi:unnamed protein product [Echinostoma caproni]|uniref:Aquaporin n=1 Tax=Echinostoma caproni TaxID=27848 RepID=A0A183AXZ4_9TREM|nr:unnamed protein product [Echinostoma caproni]